MSINIDTTNVKNLPADSSGALPNNFELSPDGKSAIKYCVITDESGETKRYSFKINLTLQNIKNSNYDFLKNFTDAKVLALAKQSFILGLGKTFSGFNFSYGKESQLRLKNYNGNEEVISARELRAKELELSQMDNDKNTSTLKTIRTFRTLEYAIEDALTGRSQKSIQEAPIKHIKNVNRDLLEKTKEKERLERVKSEYKLELLSRIENIRKESRNLYKDNILVSIFYTNIYENIDKVSVEELKRFLTESSSFKE